MSGRQAREPRACGGARGLWAVAVYIAIEATSKRRFTATILPSAAGEPPVAGRATTGAGPFAGGTNGATPVVPWVSPRVA